MNHLLKLFIGFSLAATIGSSALGQAQLRSDTSWAGDPPNLNTLVSFAQQESELQTVLTRYMEDLASLRRRYPVPYSPVRRQRLNRFLTSWEKEIKTIPFNTLSHEAQIDYVLLKTTLEFEITKLSAEEKRWQDFSKMVPFADSLRLLQENRFDKKPLDSRATAGMLDALADTIDKLTVSLQQQPKTSKGVVEMPGITGSIALRAADYIDQLKRVVADWNLFYDGYDPWYNFWVRKPYQRVQEGLENYRKTIIRQLVGITPGDPGPIIGDPVFASGLKADLDHEMIPYSPEELLAIGEKEFEWTTNQMKQVSRAMGFGDNWLAAMDKVKSMAPPPGEVVADLYNIANYSFRYVDSLNYVTIPPLTLEVWRLRMRTPAEQIIAPFFLGGEYTSASYPTDAMEHKDKMMSMRGNTPYFNFPTVQHELIPGHYLQSFMSQRFNTERNRLYRTPFWHEGNAFHWEMLLWNEGFFRSNEDKIGMLFWRLHRAGRIIFSLNFHLGNWTPEQCVEFLVKEVGHERANAEAEVRRSFSDPYFSTMPLYQLAYAIGALQHQALYDEIVKGGKMSAREFHDGILIGGAMPIEMVRARLLNLPLKADYKPHWRWSGDVLKKKK